ncbi:MAG: peptidylprolyl isomerase [Muribaculaceae bacterium]|nr:peptidylprolyl isomerase [Muribaculaceae bacterium]
MKNESETQAPVPAGPVVELNTTLGPVKIKLYDDTPLHRDNFLKLVGENYYDGVLFHRVIKDFMVQAGDPKSKDAPAGAMLGAGDPGYTIEAEIKYPQHYHKYGALAAARTGDQVNPEKRSSGSQFYIVTGRKYSRPQVESMVRHALEGPRMAEFNRLQTEHRDEIIALRRAHDQAGLDSLRDRLVEELNLRIPEPEVPAAMVEEYVRNGGTPSLDGEYTVFGEVLEGMDIIERLQNVATDSNDRPLEDVKILGVKVVE